MKAIDIAGHRYGRLVAVKRNGHIGGRIAWDFYCDCGNEKRIRIESVRQGTVKSCGCLLVETTRKRSLKHGHRVGRRETPTFKAWEHAKQRCFNQNCERFPQYGGRGISMCGEWANNFSAFLRDMGEKPKGLTLERINVDGNYEPGNCIWATHHTQARNRTDNVFIEHNGMRIVLKDFAEIMGVSYKALHARIRYKGQSPHEAAAALASR